MIGDHLFVLANGHLMVWDSPEDSWEDAPLPRAARWGALVADGTRLVVASGGDENGVQPDRVLDTTTGEWSSLPEDPLQPSYAGPSQRLPRVWC